MAKKLSIEEVRRRLPDLNILGFSKDFDDFRSDVVNANRYIRWVCPTCSRVLDQLSVVLFNGGRCKYCTPKKKELTKEEIQDRFQDIIVHEIVGSGRNRKVVWSCIKGHKHSTALSFLTGGYRCKECAIERSKGSKEDLQIRCPDIEIVGDYINSETKIEWICPICKEHYFSTPHNLTKKNPNRCPKCSRTNQTSRAEKELQEFLLSLGFSDMILNTKSIIPPYEIDIYIPSKNLAIEYDGLYFHNSDHVDKNYHLMKTKLCSDVGVRLIHIFEDEWLQTPDIVKSKLRNILGVIDKVYYARKLSIREVSDTKLKNFFLDSNHLQGSTSTSINIGLFNGDELVSLMCFSKYTDYFILDRFCSKLDTNVVGGFSRLLKYFIINYHPSRIDTYAELRWTDYNVNNSVYMKNGFSFVHYNKPSFWWTKASSRVHRRYGQKKNIQARRGVPIDWNLTEYELMAQDGYKRIYDCGTVTFRMYL